MLFSSTRYISQTTVRNFFYIICEVLSYPGYLCFKGQEIVPVVVGPDDPPWSVKTAQMAHLNMCTYACI